MGGLGPWPPTMEIFSRFSHEKYNNPPPIVQPQNIFCGPALDPPLVGNLAQHTDLKKGLDRATSIQKLRPKLSAVAMFDGTTLLLVHYRGDAYHERNRREEFDL